MEIDKLNIHLLISILIVIPAGIIYGFFPNVLLDIQTETLDEANFNKAIMMLYLGFSGLWIFGLAKQEYFKPALISNTIFMLCLGFGRLLSMILDGIPSLFYTYGMIGELVLGAYGFWVLKANPLK